MEYQILNRPIKINKGKNIGTVLYIVEGESREIKLLGHIFKKVLEYEQINSISRNGKKYVTLMSETNKNSKIYIINSETSNIGSIKNTKFIDDQVKLISSYDFDFSYEDIPIFYIFDCDRQIDKEKTEQLLSRFINSREPIEKYKFDSIGGMLLLSYPSIETFVISNFEKNMYKFSERFDFRTQKLKKYINDKKYQNSNITDKTIKNAFEELAKSLELIDIKEICLENVENFNKTIFEIELINNNTYMLSLVLISFLDLGIIEY